jgi:hypothetical protein
MMVPILVHNVPCILTPHHVNVIVEQGEVRGGEETLQNDGAQRHQIPKGPTAKVRYGAVPLRCADRRRHGKHVMWVNEMQDVWCPQKTTKRGRA